MAELKPCPFCGGEIEINVNEVKEYSAHIECTCSGCRMEFAHEQEFVVYKGKRQPRTEYFDTAWNRRTPEIVKVETNFYDKEETFQDCTVQVLTNTATGETSVGWWRNG